MDQPVEGHPRRWAILGVLVVSLLVVVLDNTVLNIALPTIQEDLDASQSELVWAVDSYILVFAALLFTWGVLGDRYGRRRILLIGLTVFAVASAACAFSVSAAMLIGFRGLMGVGGAAVLPVTLAIITVVFPPHERGRAIGAWAPSSTLFFLGEIFLLAICLNFAVRLSRASVQLKNLGQEVAILRARLDALKNDAPQ